MREVAQAGNTHIMAVWRYSVLDLIGGYPHRTGDEDQAFNLALQREGISPMPVVDHLEPDRIFSVYRWGVSHKHLSGSGGTQQELETAYDRIGQAEIRQGFFELQPRSWQVPTTRISP